MRHHTISDVDGHKALAYTNEDTDFKKIRVELAAKKLKNILTSQGGGETFEYKRRAGLVSSGWARLGHAEAPDRSCISSGTTTAARSIVLTNRGPGLPLLRRSGTQKPQRSRSKPLPGVEKLGSVSGAFWNICGLQHHNYSCERRSWRNCENWQSRIRLPLWLKCAVLKNIRGRYCTGSITSFPVFLFWCRLAL